MLPEEITRFIGQGGGVGVLEIEKGAIRRFADAVDDQNPLYYDEEYTRNSRYGAIIAPPGFFGWAPRRSRGFALPSEEAAPQRPDLAKFGYSRIVDGGVEYEFFRPIRAGDTLAASSTIKDIFEREGKTGKMAFVINETTYVNQNGDMVAKARGTVIYR